jgi:hypothetical protein
VPATADSADHRRSEGTLAHLDAIFGDDAATGSMNRQLGLRDDQVHVVMSDSARAW